MVLFFADLKKAFSLFDYDKDGVISINDMKIVLKSLGHRFTEEQLEDLIKKIDRNGKRLKLVLILELSTVYCCAILVRSWYILKQICKARSSFHLGVLEMVNNKTRKPILLYMARQDHHFT